MPSLADLLRQSGQDDDHKPRISHAGQVASLTEYLAAYRSPATFKVGDLVTPTRSSCVRGVGEPHIVLDVLQDAPFAFHGEPGTNFYGKRLNVRRACLTPDGRIGSYWMEHSDLELYRSDAATAEDESAEFA